MRGEPDNTEAMARALDWIAVAFLVVFAGVGAWWAAGPWGMPATAIAAVWIFVFVAAR